MRKTRAYVLCFAVAMLVAIPALFWYQDWAVVESSPVGNYYHYTYRVNVVFQNTTDFSVMVPVIIYQNGSTANFMSPVTVIGNATSSIVATTYGIALKIDGTGNVTIAANGEYDALHNSNDHKSDGAPTFSTWNITPEDSRGGRSNGTIRMSSSVDNISITIDFEAWYKWWHVKEGFFNHGYHRGGGGYHQWSRVALLPGWHEYIATCATISVE